ncbi:hypothetical protein CEXT_298031 [Caerostris extrusa]|uniref:Uncharacterized protein n=1 Tax=Caerostris extrusa TaxID=172846 RepID=A0AAV4XPE1_CAEEX|nr:hypothetical protein CEXT_298031 [Caerostris extrusa]
MYAKWTLVVNEDVASRIQTWRPTSKATQIYSNEPLTATITIHIDLEMPPVMNATVFHCKSRVSGLFVEYQVPDKIQYDGSMEFQYGGNIILSTVSAWGMGPVRCQYAVSVWYSGGTSVRWQYGTSVGGSIGL